MPAFATCWPSVSQHEFEGDVIPAGSVTWRWRPRANIPEPQAAVAWASAASRLHERLLRLPPQQQALLSACASRDALVAVGPAAALPWVEGIAYAAPHPEAPGLWLPTLLEPEIPCDLLARALQLQHRRQPLLLWPRPEAVLPLDRQLTVSPALLMRIRQHWNQGLLQPADEHAPP